MCSDLSYWSFFYLLSKPSIPSCLLCYYLQSFIFAQQIPQVPFSKCYQLGVDRAYEHQKDGRKEVKIVLSLSLKQQWSPLFSGCHCCCQPLPLFQRGSLYIFWAAPWFQVPMKPQITDCGRVKASLRSPTLAQQEIPAVAPLWMLHSTMFTLPLSQLRLSKIHITGMYKSGIMQRHSYTEFL